MIRPQVSVIIPSYNHADFIVETLESVLNQTFKDFECIIIDDGSTDKTKEIVINWIAKDKRFTYYHQNNAGVSKARNRGISQSVGTYILPLDSDDKISSNYIENCFNALQDNFENVITYGTVFRFGNSNQKMNLDQYQFEDILYKNMIHCAGLFNKKHWENSGGYDENLKEGLEDWEFWINILKKGVKVKSVNDCYLYYRHKNHSLNTDSVINNQHGYNSRLYIFEKHIDVYCKTNFYDMYFDNYRLTRNVKNPLRFLSSTKLFMLFFESVLKDSRNFVKRLKKFIQRKLTTNNFE